MEIQTQIIDSFKEYISNKQSGAAASCSGRCPFPVRVQASAGGVGMDAGKEFPLL